MQMSKILVINAGSSSLKFKLFNLVDLAEVAFGVVEKIGQPQSTFAAHDQSKKLISTKTYPESINDHYDALALVVEFLKTYLSDITYIGHRVVHGGEDFWQTTLVNDIILESLEKYNELAPLHNPINLLCLRECVKKIPVAKNFAVFDTAWFKHLPAKAFLYALPLKFYQENKVRKYGFHGISHHYAAVRAAAELGRSLKSLNLITCHLGSGSSVTAVAKGRAVDTSMGFTPTEGLMMMTRSGDLDPLVPLYLQQRLNLSAEQLKTILDEKSGIFGITQTEDFREVLLAAGERVAGYKSGRQYSSQEKKLAKLALAMFIYRLAKYLAAYAGLLGKVDAIVFTGAIGQNSSVVRQKALQEAHLGGKVEVIVVPTDEELMIVQEVKTTLNSKS